MEPTVDFFVYSDIIKTTAEKYTQKRMYNTRIMDEEDLIQEGHIVLCTCMEQFKHEKRKHRNVDRAFKCYFMHALRMKFMAMNFKVQRQSKSSRELQPFMTPIQPDESYAVMQLDEKLEVINDRVGSRGVEFLIFCMNPPEFVVDSVINKVSTFKSEIEKRFEISGRQRVKLQKSVEACFI